jgi:hypothetical protein
MCPATGTTTSSSELPQAPSTRAALALLLGCYRCAELLRRPAWDFAPDLARLREVGLSDEALGALVARGAVVHQAEPPRPNGLLRRPPATATATWSAQSRFMLTAEGVTLGLWAASPQADAAPRGPARQAAGGPPTGHEKPEWEPALRELRYRGQVVKRFHRAAQNQECLLNSFQELGWPCRLDDPLPAERGTDAAERLRDTVKTLNRSQQRHLLVFRAEVDGRGVRWAPLEGGGPDLPAPPPIFP